MTEEIRTRIPLSTPKLINNKKLAYIKSRIQKKGLHIGHKEDCPHFNKNEFVDYCSYEYGTRNCRDCEYVKNLERRKKIIEVLKNYE